MPASELPVLIIGAGVVGLTLAHALKNKNIPFLLLERSPAPRTRPQGWAITLHWTLPYLEQILSPEVFSSLSSSAAVDPEIARNDTGNFLFLNLENCAVRFRIPPNKRLRVGREGYLEVLLAGLEGKDVAWGKELVDFQIHASEDGQRNVTASFEDWTKYTGRVLVGIDGSASTVRKLLCPTTHALTQLPIRLFGTSCMLTPAQVAPLRALDPLLFQGCHPVTNTFFWFSILSTPATNGTEGYLVRFILSWPVSQSEREMTGRERVEEMKRRAEVFDKRLQEAVGYIPEDADVRDIKVADWEAAEWDNREGLVTLAGDAAHAMTMYRGEGANHGILDAFHLAQHLEAVYHGGVDADYALRSYETELRARTRPAVLLSRRACLEAHDWGSLKEGCAILARRGCDEAG